ncbi:MAG TPA: hypothetical protein VIY48_19570 [Candidatus Paceibacterota bacterium]
MKWDNQVFDPLERVNTAFSGREGASGLEWYIKMLIISCCILESLPALYTNDDAARFLYTGNRPENGGEL